MQRGWFLAAALALGAAPASAAVAVSIRLPEAAAPRTAEKLAQTEALLERLLADGALPAEGPFVGAKARYTRRSPAGLRPGLPPEESEALRAGLRGLWGDAFEFQETPDAPAPPPAPRRPALDRREQARLVSARLDVGPTRERQDLYYDRAAGRAAPAAVAVGGSPASAPPVLPAPAPGPKGVRTGAPPAPAAAKPAEPVRWGRVGVEVFKGAGETVRSVFTWRGLATAAAAVAIVTVAPVAVYGFLAVGAAVGGYTIGKALYDGVRAHRRGDADAVYAASREFGKGALTVGLSLYGARHAPASLRPHFPKPSEFRALLSSMDDEAVVAATVLDKVRGK